MQCHAQARVLEVSREADAAAASAASSASWHHGPHPSRRHGGGGGGADDAPVTAWDDDAGRRGVTQNITAVRVSYEGLTTEVRHAASCHI